MMVKLTNQCSGTDFETDLKNLIKFKIRRRLKKVVQLVTDVAKKSEKNVERIHHLRTETRRADAALRLFSDWLPRRRTKRVRQLLDQIRNRASSVRDLDVLMPHLKALDSQLCYEAVTWLQERALAMRKKNSSRLKHYCKQLLDRGIDREMQSLANRVDGQAFITMPDHHEMLVLSTSRLATRFEASIESLTSDARQFHQVRILGRRLRYTLELLKDVVSESLTEAACRFLSQLQDSLGDANDQQSTLRFLQMRASECNRLPFKGELCQTITTFETVTAIQLDSVICDAIEKSKCIKESLAQLRPVTIPETNADCRPE